MTQKTSILGIFCLSVLLISPHFDLAQAAPIEDSDEDNDDFNSIERTSGNSSLPGEERGGHFEGDMILPELTATSGVKNENRRWPNAVVIYKMDSKFSDSEVEVIKMAMEEISEKTCVQFKARTGESEYVEIVRGKPGSGCNAHVGFWHEHQVINLEPESPSSPGTCIHHGVVMHEILHTLGFYHEQSRTDRDDFVTINRENLKGDTFTRNFKKYGSDYITDFNISYDYNSIMHYGAFSFAENPSVPTIIPKKSGVKIGQRKELSEKDVMKINAMYSKHDQKCFILTLESKMEMMSREMSENQEKLRNFTAEMEENKKARNSYAIDPKARLYSKPNFTGDSEDFNISPHYSNPDCYNLEKISGNVKSIQTFDSCVRVYSKRGCSGSMRPFLPGLNDHKSISGISVISIGPCYEAPSFGWSIEAVRKGLNAIMETTPKARLYSERNQTGEVEEYNLADSYTASCRNLTVLAGKVKSVDNVGRCFRLFTKSDCGGTMYKVGLWWNDVQSRTVVERCTP